MKEETENYILRTYTIKFNINSTEWIFLHFVLFIYFHISFSPPTILTVIYTYMYVQHVAVFVASFAVSVAKSTKAAAKTVARMSVIFFFTFKHHRPFIHLQHIERIREK